MRCTHMFWLVLKDSFKSDTFYDILEYSKVFLIGYGLFVVVSQGYQVFLELLGSSESLTDVLMGFERFWMVPEGSEVFSDVLGRPDAFCNTVVHYEQL